MIGLFVLLFLGGSFAAATGALEMNQRAMELSLKRAMVMRRVFYRARATESLFWSGMMHSAEKEIERWERDGGTGWLDADGNLHIGNKKIVDLIETLPGRVQIVKRYPSRGRDVIFRPIRDGGFETYALIASGEMIEIEA